MRELSQANFNCGDPFTVSGTPFTVGNPRCEFNSWEVQRNGKRDVKLSAELSIRSRDPVSVAAWLREVHASEQPRRFTTEVGSYEVFCAGGLARGKDADRYADVYHDSGDSLLRKLHEFTRSIPVPTRFRLVLEEIK